MRKKIQMSRGAVLLVLIIGLAAGWMTGSLVMARAGGGSFGIAERVPLLVASSSPVPAKAISFENGFTAVVEKIRPAVVNISSTKIIRSADQGPSSPFFFDPFLRRFFGNEMAPFFDIPKEQRERSLGSGVVVSPDGYILTNNHVVEGADEVEVYLSDKRRFKAKVVGADSKTDLAVLRLAATNLPVMTLGDSSKVTVGDFVLAAGDPYGIGETFTMGIVSATGRGGLGIEDYEDFIQTDAAINPGNSGGALVNVRGELIGINTAILSRAGGNQGIGFAIPVNLARNVMQQIIQHGKVTRGWLGVSVQPMTPAMARVFGLKEAQGALIGDVQPDSPAAAAGLMKGDVVLELNGKPVEDSRGLSLQIAAIAPDTVVQLKIFRNRAEQNVSVKLGQMPNARGQNRAATGSSENALQGLSVENLTPQMARQLNLPRQTAGVVVAGVEAGSAAAEAGLRRGDVIEEANRQPVSDVQAFRRAAAAAGNQPILLLINREGSTFYIVIEAQP